MDENLKSRAEPDWPAADSGMAPVAAPSPLPADSDRALGMSLEPAELVVDGRAVISTCNSAAARLFGYPQAELPGVPVTKLLPILASFEISRGGLLDPTLAFLCHSGITFTGLKRDGTNFRCQLTLVNFGRSTADAVTLIAYKVDEPTPTTT